MRIVELLQLFILLIGHVLAFERLLHLLFLAHAQLLAEHSTSHNTLADSNTKGAMGTVCGSIYHVW